jgi:cytochrome c-type biogenesis protein CcmH/NrfG
LIDSIIAFYENNEQYNFSAWFHTKKAEILQTPESWRVAGKRQYSVSQNEAYEADFNMVLRQQGIQSYQKAVALDSTNLDTRVDLATCYLDDGATTMDGITLLLGVIEEDSLHINANILLGRFGIVSSQYNKAIKRLENVLSLQPENTEALFLMGEAYVGLDEIDKAIETFEKVKEIVENEEIKKEIDVYINEISS